MTSTVRLSLPATRYDAGKKPHSTPRSEADRLPVTEAVAIAQRALPNAKVMWIGFPSRAGKMVYGRTAPTGEVREAEGQSEIWIDQYSGAVLRLQTGEPSRRAKPLSPGSFPSKRRSLRTTGRWIVLLSGFLPSVLYVTALRMWWLKRHAHLRQRLLPTFSR